MVRILDEACNSVEPITTETCAKSLHVTRLSSRAGFGGSKKSVKHRINKSRFSRF